MSNACACVYVDVDEPYTESGSETRVAGTEHKCGECNRIIELGEEYEHSWGGWLDEDDLAGEIDIFVTCRDCESVRKSFFCSGWYWGRVWEDLGEHLYDVVRFGAGVANSCLTPLTKPARDRVCDMIEEIWAEQDE